ncbi:VanZ family protein [Bacillus salacetis]|uniref:VanZ family protein n=1 Tax=Bacillus salacetis TaxID=2315464 RepID=UPI003BA0A7C3
MRILIVFLYLSLLFIMTCTASFSDFIEHQQIRFLVTSQPDFLSFFKYRSFHYSDPFYIAQKSGHAVSFFILSFLLMALFNSLRAVIYVTWPFAFFTEIAQLFFSRTGCLVDVMYDMAGVMAFLMVYFLSRIVIGSAAIR